MLGDICAELLIYFLRDRVRDILAGTFVISDGSIESLPFLQDGQYYRIVGSVFNDGVYQYPDAELTDEEFTGAIWAMAVPPAVIALASDIADWNTANADALASPYTSESFGGYSYSLKSGSTSGGASLTWRDQFASRLSKWRRLSVL